MRAGDAITLRLAPCEESESEEEDEGDPSPADELRTIAALLRGTRVRSEIAALMRRRNEVAVKQAALLASMPPPCGLALTPRRRALLDERSHCFRVMHVNRGTVTLDRPGTPPLPHPHSTITIVDVGQTLSACWPGCAAGGELASGTLLIRTGLRCS